MDKLLNPEPIQSEMSEELTEFQVTRGSVAQERLYDRLLSRFCIETLRVEANSFPVSLPLEVLVSLLFEVLRNLCEP